MRRVLELVAVVAVAASLSGCAFFSNEGWRVFRSYSASDRGEEEYAPGATESTTAVTTLNNHLSQVYAMRTAITLAALEKNASSIQAATAIGEAIGRAVVVPPVPSGTAVGGTTRPSGGVPAVAPSSLPATATPPATSSGSPTDRSPSVPDTLSAPGRSSPPPSLPEPGQTHIAQIPGTSPSSAGGGGPSSTKGMPSAGSDASLYNYSLIKFWPEAALNAAIGKLDASSVTDYTREQNDILTKQLIRDLLTEPSIVTMVPTKRTVRLRCAPPPEQASIQTAASLAAKVTKGGVEVGVDARLAESLVKLFEQTERTIFLQYALFRLCEMSINSAGEFRNVFPLVVQELVRQSATLSAQQQIEGEKTKQTEAHAQIAVAKVALDRLECIKREHEKKVDISAKDLVTLCGAAPAFDGPRDVSGVLSAPAAPATPLAPTAPATLAGDKKPPADAKTDKKPEEGAKTRAKDDKKADESTAKDAGKEEKKIEETAKEAGGKAKAGTGPSPKKP